MIVIIPMLLSHKNILTLNKSCPVIGEHYTNMKAGEKLLILDDISFEVKEVEI
jgi:hypothetical protein